MQWAIIDETGRLWILDDKIIKDSSGAWIYNPTEEDYRRNGALPFEESERPEPIKGYHLEEVLSVANDKITRTYIQVEDEVGEPTDFDRLEAQVMWTAMMTDTLIEEE